MDLYERAAYEDGLYEGKLRAIEKLREIIQSAEDRGRMSNNSLNVAGVQLLISSYEKTVVEDTTR